MGSIGCDDIGDIANAPIVQRQISKIRLRCVDQNSEQLENGLLGFALGEGFHGGGYQIELLLQIVEANLDIDAVPVEYFVLLQFRLDQSAINSLLI